jgi:cytochrome c oxidase assembly protein subunit 15
MRGHDVFRIVAVVAVLLTYLTILLGGNVAASDSGLACPDWPSCAGTYTPALSGGVTIEWSHRLSAFTLSMTIVVLFALALTFERRRRVLIGLSGLALATVAGQAIMGGVVVLSDLSPWAVVVHLGLATVLFGVLLLLTLLANLREIPRKWVEWIRTASTERPVTDAELRRAQGRDSPLPGSSTSGVGPIRPS